MFQALSVDLRSRVLAAVAGGANPRVGDGPVQGERGECEPVMEAGTRGGLTFP